MCQLDEEPSWRTFHPADQPHAIVVTRWKCSECPVIHESAPGLHERHFIGVALTSTRMTLTRDRETLFDGHMPTGTMYMSRPSDRFIVRFDAPCDFIHLHVCAEYVRSLHSDPRYDSNFEQVVVARDILIEHLAKAILTARGPGDHDFILSTARTLAMYALRLEHHASNVNALPKWRLKRVDDFVRSHCDKSIHLSDLANAAGLSRMHFAAQFRAATGLRPREYLLLQRIEHAKSFLVDSQTPLAQIALEVGFCTQAHFSTVFKRLTGSTPARWRDARKKALAKSSSTGRGHAPSRSVSN